jgi:hypothetical protein
VYSNKNVENLLRETEYSKSTEESLKEKDERF